MLNIPKYSGIRNIPKNILYSSFPNPMRTYYQIQNTNKKNTDMNILRIPDLSECKIAKHSKQLKQNFYAELKRENKFVKNFKCLPYTKLFLKYYQLLLKMLNCEFEAN